MMSLYNINPAEKDPGREYANPMIDSVLDGILGTGNQAYLEGVESPKLDWAVINRLFVGESESMYDPQGELAKAFNLPMAIQIYCHDGKVYGIDWMPLLNTQGDIGSRLLTLAIKHDISIEKKKALSLMLNNLTTLLPAVVQKLISGDSVEPKLEYTRSMKRVSPFITYDSEGRAMTNFAEFSEFSKLPEGLGHDLPKNLNDIGQILGNKEFLELVQQGQCPTFVWNHSISKYELADPTKQIAPREDRHFLSDPAFAEAVENFSYTCTDAMPYTYINGKIHVAIANRKKIESVVYPHPWLFGGRLPANKTAQLAVAEFVNADIFRKGLSPQEVEEMALSADLFSHNIAYYRDPSRGGASKSTTNLTFDIYLPPELVSRIQTLKETEYDGPLYWISLDSIKAASEKTNQYNGPDEVVLETVDAQGNPICVQKTDDGKNECSITLKISRDQPGIALWNKLEEFSHRSNSFASSPEGE